MISKKDLLTYRPYRMTFPFVYNVDDKTSINITCRSRNRVIVGDCSGTLHVDNVWPGSVVAADFLRTNPVICKDKRVLEFGAGTALPSLVANALGADSVLITDFPDVSVIQNLKWMVQRNNCSKCQVIPFKWGDSIEFLRSDHEPFQFFHLIILSELLWKDTYYLHEELLQSVAQCLCRESGIVLVSFVHRTTEDHTEANNLEFFQRAETLFGLTSSFVGSFDQYKDCDADGADDDEQALVMLFLMYYSRTTLVDSLLRNMSP